MTDEQNERQLDSMTERQSDFSLIVYLTDHGYEAQIAIQGTKGQVDAGFRCRDFSPRPVQKSVQRLVVSILAALDDLAKCQDQATDSPPEDFQSPAADPVSDPVADCRKPNGTLIEFAFPGAYPIFYLDEFNRILCPTCANKQETENKADPESAVKVVSYRVYEEGPTLYCEECNREIESAYGDPVRED